MSLGPHNEAVGGLFVPFEKNNWDSPCRVEFYATIKQNETS